MGKSVVPGLSRGLELIEIVAQEKVVGFNRLKMQTGLNTSSLNRILTVLVASGYIQKDSNGKYILGYKPFVITRNESIWRLLIDRTAPVLHSLSTEFEVTALLYGFSEDGITVLDKVAHPDNISMREVGHTKKDYLLNPCGFLYLADLPDEQRIAFIKIAKTQKWSTLEPPSDKMLHEFITFAMQKGYADDLGSLLRNKTRRIAVPVYGMENDLVASMAIGTFTALLTQQKLKKITNRLIAMAHEISHTIRGENNE
jgi:DNA-binding IclR family transcriptional regulator